MLQATFHFGLAINETKPSAAVAMYRKNKKARSINCIHISISIFHFTVNLDVQ
jgi:hypothetical protein